ncbi:high-affinity nickel-transport protein-domain-containing protein [Cladorrhinum samala]|uniref:Nickel/cobalt efflux system n=1 Tax=Cladorrhinum samala TaxID=585594 RepID=A0AAV9HT82_9PEZI|nr:high-affinity nickel-transport protein-domain-containing protein [Cladorrhinum samala]
MALFPLPRIRVRLPPRIAAPLKSVPAPAYKLIGLLVLINIIVWVAAGILLRYYPKLISSTVLAYTLGLRHALDADHISAIDLMTRRLIASGQRPVSVGTFFSLGHSTVVIVTSIVVAATAGALQQRFDDFQRVGGIIGVSVSGAFLLLLCVGNGWVLFRLVTRLKQVLAQERAARQANEAGSVSDVADVDVAAGTNVHQLEGLGFLSTVFRKVFRVVDRPWKMLPLGILFGLGFDTSSEIALLGIASIEAAKGTSIWVILIFPALFTVGMCMIDTTDGALMMALYTNKAFSRDIIAILYYSIVLTGITVFVAAFIGIIQILTLVENVAEPEGSFWDGVSAIGDHYDVIGGCICGLFLLVGLGSVLVYRPWRKRAIERRVADAPSPARGENVASSSEGVESLESPAPLDGLIHVGPPSKAVASV